jgi:hypothetical protein
MGLVFAAMLFAWISKRVEQAAAEGLHIEAELRKTGLNPEPWDAGVIGAILMPLADDPRFDWSKPLSTWSRAEMMEFIGAAVSLAAKAKTARDLGSGITRRNATQAQEGDAVTWD